MTQSYILNNRKSITINNKEIINNNCVFDAILFCNDAIKSLDYQTKQFDINIFQVLGMRNLSGLVGEYFAKSIQHFANGTLSSNLHQDGYPDLVLTDSEETKSYYDSLYVLENGKKYTKNKFSFSPFKYGGVEVKATCGSTPTGTPEVAKPVIGDQRISLINSFDWKAHHRDTNNLLAILWDFIEEIPTITACFYCDELIVDDWGKIVQPQDGGGRTTSVSIMKSQGIKKMCENWIAVINKPEYINALSKKKWIGKKVDDMTDITLKFS